MKLYTLNTRILLFVFILQVMFTANIYAQHNFLGKDKSYIINYFKIDPEFTVSIDTIRSNKLQIICKTSSMYPYHTYEIDLISDVCISYGFISKNRDVFNTYIENLDYLGKIVKADSSYKNFVYSVELSDRRIYYSIKQPFADSNIKTRRNLFYILITEERKKNSM